MSIFKYLKSREIGIYYKWDIFEDIYPGADINDWRRGHQIIKLRNQEKVCKTCYNNYQIMLIKIPDMIDLYHFEIHLFCEYGCMYCNYYLYKNNL